MSEWVGNILLGIYMHCMKDDRASMIRREEENS